jgi:PKD repeat protein
MAIEKLTSYDSGYVAGDLSVYKSAIDNYETLYEAKNLASSKTLQFISVSDQLIVVPDNDALKFPEKGILRLFLRDKVGLNAELVYYNKRTNNTFTQLIRGFCSTKQSVWPVGTAVEAGVMAEHHNSVKDAIINLETYLGVEEAVGEDTLTGILKIQESKILSPKALFRAFPTVGAPPLTVNFHTFSNSNSIRFFWEFGDGGSSFDKNPTHTYEAPGNYTITFRVITSLGAQGFTVKKDYISVANDYALPFTYVSPLVGVSKRTAAKSNIEPTNFLFVDQTRAEITNRLWQFGDGTTSLITNPNVHTAQHQYENPGSYDASVLIELVGQRVIRVFLTETIMVT